MKKQTVSTFIKTLSFYFLSCMLVAANGTGATAGGSKSMTWGEIKISEFYKADFPRYEMENYSVGYNQLCMASDDIIQTKKQYLIGWTKVSGAYIYQYDYLSRPKDITRRVCLELNAAGNCIWEEVIDSIPEEQPIKIHRFENGEWKLDDVRNYELQFCENVRTVFI